MNNSFVAVDNLNSVAFDCYSLVKFNYAGNDYLIYYSFFNESSCNIFLSKLILSDNGKYYIDKLNVFNDFGLRNKLFDIAKEIVIDIPSLYSNDNSNNFENVLMSYSDEKGFVFSKDIPQLEEQNFYNDLIASSRADFVNYVRSIYSYFLPKINVKSSTSLSSDDSVWSIPLSGESEYTSNGINNDYNVLPEISDSSRKINDLGNLQSILVSNNTSFSDNNNNNSFVDNNNVNFSNNNNNNNSLSTNNYDALNNYKIVLPTDFQSTDNNSFNQFNNNSNFNNNLNYNYDNFNNNYLGVTSYSNQFDNYSYNDNSSSSGGTPLNQQQAPVIKTLKKNAGYASNKYIVIGTVSLILAAIIVFASVILVRNL